MRRQIQEVPKRLPHARLFLDDLETINNIMVEEMSEQFKADVARYAVPEVGEDSNVPAKFEPRITYLLDDIEIASRLGLIDIICRRLCCGALVLLVSCLLNFLLVALGLLVYSTVHSRVYLVRSHARSKASAETRQKYTIGAIAFLLGALSTKLL